jgi:two-component system chemotaxis sensor kinase CheA
MDDLLSEFLTETAESIEIVDVQLVKLEQEPNNREVLSNIFRLVHTIKGTCGFLGLPRLGAVAHASENVLGKFRDGEIEVTPAAVTLILASLDCIKGILAEIERTEAEPEGDDEALIAALNEMAEGKAPTAAAPAPAPVAAPEPEQTLERELRPGEVSLDELERAFRDAPGPEEIAAGAPAIPVVVAAKPDDEDEGERIVAAAQAVTSQQSESSIANQSIRVNVDVLENLMTMVSELVLTRNQLLQMVRRLDNSEFSVPLQRLSHCTSELQEGVMKTRMQPIGNAWNKLPRIVRDLSHELGKKIDLQMLGADTELDRQVLELIKDPLTHMVRNSGDHGLETPVERRATGKGETGKIVLDAHHEGGHIIIRVSDDGRGLNTGRIRQKIVANGLVTEADAAGMSDAQVHKFIFHPGLSTADKITSVSGRGVGMDVVKTNIEKIGGTIDLKSEQGKGTTFTIKIPLTLAIVSALIVESTGERFAIPQLAVVELVRAGVTSEHKIEVINRTPVLRLRDRLLPLVYLDRLLGLRDDDGAAVDDEAFVVVTQVGAYSFGIVVDRVFDTEEIVVKPVAPILRDISLFSGNTILGDGSVIMILDPNGIAMSTGQAAVETNAANAAEEAARAARGGREDRLSLLVFKAGGGEPKAVPLSLVARLEEFDASAIEVANDRQVVQYRGRLMPLVTIDGSYDVRTSGRQPVLVFADEQRAMGLAVDEIVDIVEDRLDIELKSHRTGMLGTAVIAGLATEVVDVGHYLTRAFDDWFEKLVESDGRANGNRLTRVLLVDDSPFFRNMLRPLLSVAGYDVTTAENADSALKLREAGVDFDVIVSDIEMPGMDGFAFAEAVKADTRWQNTPLVALSSRTSPSDFDRGREVGFTDYVAKFDRDALLESLSQTVLTHQAGAA